MTLPGDQNAAEASVPVPLARLNAPAFFTGKFSASAMLRSMAPKEWAMGSSTKLSKFRFSRPENSTAASIATRESSPPLAIGANRAGPLRTILTAIHWPRPWRCFGKCRKSGDVTDLEQALYGGTRAEAAARLGAQRACEQLPKASKQEPTLGRPLPDLSGLEICCESDLEQIRRLRSIPLEGLVLAYERKLLFAYEDPFQGRCWVISDDARRNAIKRRIDGERFHYRNPEEGKKEGPKAKCWPHANANWPIGIAQAIRFPAISLCEGGPDFLAALALAHAGAVESLVAPVCMTGSSCHIDNDALPLFRGKRVRIFADADEAGQSALQRWPSSCRRSKQRSTPSILLA